MVGIRGLSRSGMVKVLARASVEARASLSCSLARQAGTICLSGTSVPKHLRESGGQVFAGPASAPIPEVTMKDTGAEAQMCKHPNRLSESGDWGPVSLWPEERDRVDYISSPSRRHSS